MVCFVWVPVYAERATVKNSGAEVFDLRYPVFGTSQTSVDEPFTYSTQISFRKGPRLWVGGPTASRRKRGGGRRDLHRSLIRFYLRETELEGSGWSFRQ